MDSSSSLSSSDDPAAHLTALLASHDLTTSALASFALQSYFPQSPRNVPAYNISNYWSVQVVTPIPQGIDSVNNGSLSLVQAVLFENPTQTERVLTFMGVDLNPADPAKGTDNDYANPYSTCLASDYEFMGTDAESAWQETCTNAGRVETNITAWSEQAGELVQRYQPTFLSGHSQGCTIAISEAILSSSSSSSKNNGQLPAVCFDVPGSLSDSWVAGYLGLSAKIINEEEGAGVFAAAKSSIYTLEVQTGPYANCILPVPSNPNKQVATVCSFRGTLPSCGLNTNFSYHPFSECVQQAHYVSAIQNVPEQFAADDCTMNEHFWLENNNTNHEEGMSAEEIVALPSRFGRVCPHAHDEAIYSSGSSSILLSNVCTLLFVFVAMVW